MDKKLFQHRFQTVLILCSLSGFYIPGIKKITLRGSYHIPVAMYFLFFYVLSWYNAVDMVLMLVTKELPFVTAFELTALFAMILWMSTTSLCFFIARHDVEKLITYWNGMFQPLFPNLRENVLEREQREILEKCKRILKFYVLPNSLVTVLCIAKGELATPSMLGIGISRNAYRLAIVPQSASFICWFLMYCAYQTLFTLVLRLLLAELKYLEQALEKILEEKNDETFRQRLGKFVTYHSKVIAFSKMVQIIFTPTMLLEFFVLTTFVCSLGYCATTGLMEPDVTFYATFSVGVNCFMSSLTCRIGDDIKEAGFRVGETAFQANRTSFPVPVLKVLLMIIRISYEKPIIIQPFGMFPLLSRTFHQQTFLQYRFFRCISDIREH